MKCNCVDQSKSKEQIRFRILSSKSKVQMEHAKQVVNKFMVNETQSSLKKTGKTEINKTDWRNP